MYLNINFEGDLTPTDRELLLAIANSGSAASAPAIKAAPAAPAAKAAKAAVVTPEPEDETPAEPEEAEEDLVGAATYTLDDAVALATKLVSSGGSKEVKAKLTELGAKRVSELSGDAITAFVTDLS